MVKESLKTALFCYQGFRQQAQKLGSPTGSACFQYCGISANWQCCPWLNLLARRQETMLDPWVCLNKSGIELASICPSKGLWCSWCLCKFEVTVKNLWVSDPLPAYNLAFLLMSTHLSKLQKLLKVGTIFLQRLVWHAFFPLTNNCSITHAFIHPFPGLR